MHYVVVVWLQYALLGVDLNVIGKATMVFAAALTISLAASAGLKIGIKTLISRHPEPRDERAIANQPR